MIGVISICIFIVFVLVDSIVSYRLSSYHRFEDMLGRGGLLLPFLILCNIVIMLFSLEQKESGYTETINEQNLYCELTPVKYDASFIWPGWTLDRYTDASEVTCYKLDTPVDITKTVTGKG